MKLNPLAADTVSAVQAVFSAKDASNILLTINLLRRRLRDKNRGRFEEELEFYAKELGIDKGTLRIMATLNMEPLKW